MISSSSDNPADDFFSFFRRAGKGITLTFTLFWSLLSFSQEHGHLTINIAVAEKVYLQLPSKVYATDQIIWFKAVVTDSKNNIPTDLSKVLYVDLINPNEQIVAHKLVKLAHGTGKGYFELQDDYEQGRYLIRAYTQWNRNFGDDYVFKSYVDILGIPTDEKKEVVKSVSLVERKPDCFFLIGKVDPNATANKAGKEIEVYLNWGTGQDTMTLKKKGEDGYSLEYELQDRPRWITLTLKNDLGFRLLGPVQNSLLVLRQPLW